MKLDTQKRLAADIFKCAEDRVIFDTERLEEISEAITKQDLRSLIGSGAITKMPARGVSRARANKRLVQRRKGRQRGQGTRKGRNTAREPTKNTWMNRIRLQRTYLQGLREAGSITNETFRKLYSKAKGGFFRSKRHISMYIDEQQLKVNNGKE